MVLLSVIFVPSREKTNNVVLYRSNRNRAVQAQKMAIETGDVGFRKMKNHTIRVAKTKAMISLAVTAKLICAFVFSHADCLFSHDVAHVLSEIIGKIDFFICENKDTDQLCNNCTTDQRLCFCFSNSTFALLPKSEISMIVQTDLYQTG